MKIMWKLNKKKIFCDFIEMLIISGDFFNQKKKIRRKESVSSINFQSINGMKKKSKISFNVLWCKKKIS